MHATKVRTLSGCDARWLHKTRAAKANVHFDRVTGRVRDAFYRFTTLVRGTGARWVLDELTAHGVRVRLSEGCLEELVRHADSVAWRLSSGSTVPYLSHLRQALARDANFIQAWTDSDEKFRPGRRNGRACKNCQKFCTAATLALVGPCRGRMPEHAVLAWKWASGLDSDPVPQP